MLLSVSSRSFLLNTAFPGAGSRSHRCACDSGLGVPRRNTRAPLVTAVSLVAVVARTVLERDVSHLTVSELCARPFPELWTTLAGWKRGQVSPWRGRREAA